MNALIIEDDIVLAGELQRIFKRQSGIHRVRLLHSYQEYVQEAHTLLSYDIVLVDIGLERSSDDGKTGIDIITLIRKKNKDIPLIIISAYSSISWIEKGFQVGANDYLVKPFRLKELEIRMMRWFRNYFTSHETFTYPIIQYNELRYDLSKNTFFYSNHEISLSKNQKLILSLLISQPEVLLTQSYLKDKIWGDIFQVVERNLYVHLYRLKKSLLSQGIYDYLHIIRGEGCILVKK